MASASSSSSSHGPAIGHPDPVRFLSLGVLVLDELRLPHGETRHHVGGSAAYATLGARLATPRSRDARAAVGCFVVAGYDFPPAVLARLRGLGVSVEHACAPTRPATRGLLEYHDAAFLHKSFRYLTPPLRPMPDMLPARLLAARAFHWLLPPDDLAAQAPRLLQLRRQAGVGERPLLVWEPFPAECRPAFLPQHIAACRLVDVFSPNHLELLGLFGETPPRAPPEGDAIERCAARLLDAMTAAAPRPSRHPRAVVVRAAERGSFLASAQHALWLPPVHAGADKVVDATGGGNAFLGAFAVALEGSGDLVRACAHGHVAASFAIEQVGFPTLRTDGEEDLWNESSYAKRLADSYGVA